MTKSVFFRSCVCALLLLAAAPAATGWSGGMTMEPAKTRVGVAKVKLLVHDLRRTGEGTMEGTYELRIPLAPWMNDRGAIRLQASGPLDLQMTDGGELSGSGHSELDGRTHPIVCRFGPGGTVRIIVVTPERDLAFRTSYELLDR